MYRYDVAVSFAGEDREIVERFVRILLDNRVGVFYDAIQEDSLWGKDLYQYLDTIYREAARYCVIFVSKHYAGKRWPEHELTSAQARAFQQNSEYILPSMTRACGCFLRLAARFHRPATATTDERTSTLTD